MNEGLKKLKKSWDDKPAETLLVLASVAASAAMLLNAFSAAQGRHAYAQQVKLSKIRSGI